jgi:hypothetical protein
MVRIVYILVVICVAPGTSPSSLDTARHRTLLGIFFINLSSPTSNKPRRFLKRGCVDDIPNSLVSGLHL